MRVRLQPGASGLIRHRLDAVFRRFAIMSNRPGRGGAGENKNERGHLAASSAQIHRRNQAEQGDGQSVNRQGIEQNVKIFGLLQIAQDRINHNSRGRGGDAILARAPMDMPHNPAAQKCHHSVRNP